MTDTRKNNVYITTTLPYVNADPHIGFAMEIIRADMLARYYRMMGKNVFLNTGTDEHGMKIYRKAVEQGKEPQAYVDEYATKFKDLLSLLNIKDSNFIRTTDNHHVAAAQEFWKKCDASGDIYKKNYSVKYCVGCELEKTESELVNGRCPLHPSQELDIIEEENYFFKFSKYQDKLLALYEDKKDFVIPSSRLNEIKAFVGRGLEDFSISRLASKMPWGVPVPGDADHVMYVWFDALVSYISAIGWPDDAEKFETWWPVIQYCGKDNLRQQSAMWQAMLMSANLPASEQIIINGFITSGGQKMSKSFGNVIDPVAIVNEYGAEALRYYVAREIHPFEDSDFTMERFKESYNTGLANGVGNLTSRIMKMATTHLESTPELSENNIPEAFHKAFEKYNAQEATKVVWDHIKNIDTHIQETEPFKLVKTDKEKAIGIIKKLVVDLYTVSEMLVPILPETSAKIKDCIMNQTMPDHVLFLRKD